MKKGFTLIELLAVIVILAIIALIATPLMLNVIEKSRQGAALATAYNYMDAVEKQIAINDIKGENQIYDGTYNSIDDLKNTYKVLVKGKYPSSGEIIIEKNKVKSANFVINNYEVECESSTKCVIKGKNKTINAREVEIENIQGVENVEQALNEIRRKITE